MNFIRKEGKEMVAGQKTVLDIPIWEKYSLSIEEAAVYYGIGIKKLYAIIRNEPHSDFILENGTHRRIKRRLFENYLDNTPSI